MENFSKETDNISTRFILCHPQLIVLKSEKLKIRTSRKSPKIPKHTSLIHTPPKFMHPVDFVQWPQTDNSHSWTSETHLHWLCVLPLPTIFCSSTFCLLLEDNINSTANLLSLETSSCGCKQEMHINKCEQFIKPLIYIYLQRKTILIPNSVHSNRD
jgi:hypothetical protein